MTLNTILTCSQCGKRSADCKDDPHAWDGWKIGKKEKCPACFEINISPSSRNGNGGNEKGK
jgi:hypothetical protein